MERSRLALSCREIYNANPARLRGADGCLHSITSAGNSSVLSASSFGSHARTPSRPPRRPPRDDGHASGVRLLGPLVTGWRSGNFIGIGAVSPDRRLSDGSGIRPFVVGRPGCRRLHSRVLQLWLRVYVDGRARRESHQTPRPSRCLRKLRFRGEGIAFEPDFDECGLHSRERALHGLVNDPARVFVAPPKNLRRADRLHQATLVSWVWTTHKVLIWRTLRCTGARARKRTRMESTVSSECYTKAFARMCS